MPPPRPDNRAPLRSATTRRLSIRPVAPGDLDDLAALFALRDLWEFEQGRGSTRAETQEWIDRQERLWDDHGFGGCAVRTRGADVLIGVVGLAVPVSLHELLPAVTIGWRFSPHVWGHGYATEAAHEVLRQAFSNMGLQCVGCVTNAGNRRSVAVADRLGMREVADPRPTDGAHRARWVCYEVTRDAWRAAARRDRRAVRPI